VNGNPLYHWMALVEHPGLVDPQPDVAGQTSDGVVASGRPELAAGCQLGPPAGEQRLDLDISRWHPQPRLNRGAWPIHLIERALHDTAGEIMQLDLVPQIGTRSTPPTPPHGQSGSLA
jgi:hypothetical protein